MYCVIWEDSYSFCRMMLLFILDYDYILPFNQVIIYINSEHLNHSGVPVVAQQKRIQLVSMRMLVQSLALLSGLGICRCHELWCKLQIGFRSLIAVAMAQASGCSSNLTPSLGTSMSCGCSPKPPPQKKSSKFFLLY